MEKKVKHYASIIVALWALIMAGCAGRTPNPVAQYQPGDESMTCDQIGQQIADNQTHIKHLVPKTNKTSKNVALGITGAAFIVPLFFMDFSDAEQIEIQAYQLRDNWLRTLASKKGCKVLPGIKFQ